MGAHTHEASVCQCLSSTHGLKNIMHDERDAQDVDTHS